MVIIGHLWKKNTKKIYFFAFSGTARRVTRSQFNWVRSSCVLSWELSIFLGRAARWTEKRRSTIAEGRKRTKREQAPSMHLSVHHFYATTSAIPKVFECCMLLH